MPRRDEIVQRLRDLENERQMANMIDSGPRWEAEMKRIREERSMLENELSQIEAGGSL